MVTLVGNTDINDVARCVEKAFKNIDRQPAILGESVFVAKANEVKTVEERMDIAQGKLVLGFRVDMKPNDKAKAAMRSVVDIFGGGPYSRLFTNVREKMSLCYYCSARFVRAKSMVLVQCGCEEENMDKAINEIINQLEIIKHGEFLKSEFDASKIGLTDAVSSVNDSPEQLENWYINQIIDDELTSPDESVKANNDVKIEDISELAKKITLDTVYKLMAEKEGE